MMRIRVEPNDRGHASAPPAWRVLLHHGSMVLESMDALERDAALTAARELADHLGLREIPRGAEQSDDYTVHFEE